MEAEIEHLLNGARVEHRQVQRDECGITARRERRRLGRGVVADQQHDATLATGATEAAMTNRVAGAIETGRLAVPERRRHLRTSAAS